MENTQTSYVKLGIFVTVAAFLLIISLYFIGRNRNIFGGSIPLHAVFYNVNGLTPGNNVRFAGINVGTVKKINFLNDSVVQVTMMIDNNIIGYIKKNALASIGTDGLMGNKIVNINTGSGSSLSVSKNDTLLTLKPVESDQMIRTLDATNYNIYKISTDLEKIVSSISKSSSFKNILTDTTLSINLHESIENLRDATENANLLTEDLHDISRSIRTGDGSLSQIIFDTVYAYRIGATLGKLESFSKNLEQIGKDVEQATMKLNQPTTGLGYMINDTLAATEIRQTLTNLNQGTKAFNENMEALKHNFLFRRYFRKMEKQNKP
jgi:phospholipid/cholesterol/gamma-HCH transport system substrate-binding protein